MTKNSRLRSHAAIGQLIEQFPLAFVRFGERPPLKLGIHDDLLERGIALDVVRAGLGSYCYSVRYLSAARAGAVRLDLDGNPAGVVIVEEAEHAARKLAEVIERAEQVKLNREKAAQEQARALENRKAAEKKAATAQAQPPQDQPPKPKRQAQRPPGGATVTRQPLVVRKATIGRSWARR
jgi:ProP effector